MGVYVLRRGNRREAGKFVMDWRGGKVFHEGDVITSDDLGFPLREMQLKSLHWLEEIRPEDIAEDGSVQSEPLNQVVRRRGRPPKKQEEVG